MSSEVPGLPQEWVNKAVLEMISTAAPEWVDESDLRAGLDELTEIWATAGIWHAWKTGKTELGVQDGQLVFRFKEAP